MTRSHAGALSCLDLQNIFLWSARQLAASQMEENPHGPFHAEIHIPGPNEGHIAYKSNQPLAPDEEPKFSKPELDDLLGYLARVYASPLEWAIIDEIGDYSLTQDQVLDRLKDHSIIRGLLANLVKRGVLAKKGRDGYRLADPLMTAVLRRYLGEAQTSAEPVKPVNSHK